MKNPLTLKKDDQGNTVLVTNVVTETQSPLSAEELRRQIKEQSEVIKTLQLHLQAVEEFEASHEDTETKEFPTVVDNPIVDEAVLTTITETPSEETQETVEEEKVEDGLQPSRD